MKNKITQAGLLCVVVLAFAPVPAQADFTAGDLAVLQIGTIGSGSAPSSAATALFIDQFNTTTLNQTIAPLITIPTDGSGLTLSGTATSEGELTLSSDQSKLTFGGYFASAGTLTIASSSVAREVGNLNPSAQFLITANSSSSLSGNNIRGTVSDGQNNWLVGPTGVYNQQSGNLSLTALQTTLNTRDVNIFNNNLYFSVGSGSSRGIYGYSGTPSSASSPTFFINTGSSSSPYDFALNSAGTVAYIADDRSAASGGGIQKWTYDGTTWSLAYTLALGTTTAGGARQLTVDWSGANPIIYATTTETTANRLVDLIDTGSGSTYSVLATAAANTVFRGVDFAPVPEPSTLALAGTAAIAFLGLRRKQKSAQ